jgi:predicted DNA-binding ribbon-helix-helix protein
MSGNSTKRSVHIDGHKTSISVENEIWDALREVARQKNLSTSALIATIAKSKNSDNLSSAIRVFVVNHFRTTNGLREFSHGLARTVAPQAGPGRDKTKGPA